MAHPFIAKLSPTLFWDVEIEELDPEKHRKFIINRVLGRGRMDDWCCLKAYYTIDVIVDVAKKVRTLDPKTLAFIACVGKVAREEFRCYSTKPSSGIHWVF
jgi:hypothetical protein